MNSKFYNELFDAYKQFILANSKYSPRVVKISNNTSTYFPIVVFPKPRSSGGTKTQKNIYKSRNEYFTIEQYAQNKGKVPAQVIIDELSDLSLEFFGRLNINNTLDEPKPNIDTNIIRNVQQYQCNIDNRGFITRI